MAKVNKSKDANQFAKDLLDRIIEKTESPSFLKTSKSEPKVDPKPAIKKANNNRGKRTN